MAGNSLNTQVQRVGLVKGQILAHAIPQEVIGRVGQSMKQTIPKNAGQTVIFRRWLPKGATPSNPNQWSVDPSSHQLVEGETPNSEQIVAQDIIVSLTEYGVLYRFTNRTAELSEDDVPDQMKRIAGERMGLLLEMIRWGVLKAGTNVYRAGSVASRSLVNGLLSGNLFRNIQRGLSNNLAMKITRVLTASAGVGTAPVEAAFIVIGHTDLEADIRSQLSGFIHKSEYGTGSVVHENELGSWESFRFVLSPHLTPYLQAGATATANTRLSNGIPNSAGTEACDVYPMIVLSEEAYGDVMLRGMDSFDLTMIPAGEKTKDDPLGQRGYIGGRLYYAAVRLNEGRMAVAEVAASALIS